MSLPGGIAVLSMDRFHVRCSVSRSSRGSRPDVTLSARIFTIPSYVRLYK